MIPDVGEFDAGGGVIIDVGEFDAGGGVIIDVGESVIKSGTTPPRRSLLMQARRRGKCNSRVSMSPPSPTK